MNGPPAIVQHSGPECAHQPLQNVVSHSRLEPEGWHYGWGQPGSKGRTDSRICRIHIFSGLTESQALALL